MSGYKVVAADRTSVTIEDHSKPKQKDGKLPTMTMSLDNVDQKATEEQTFVFDVGDRVALSVRKMP